MAEDLEARLNATLELVQSLNRTVQALADRLDDLHEMIERQQTGHARPWSAAARMH